jgi:hypothetical protein
MISTWRIGRFSLKAHEERWISWEELNSAARPGRRLSGDDPRRTLRHALLRSGLYFVAWSASGRRPYGNPHPAHNMIVYIGETGELCRRMGQFGNSAGFFGERTKGHSGAWRWHDEWRPEQAFLALYPAPADVVDAGLAPLWRVYREAQALAAFAQAHRLRLPELNAKGANDSVA